MFPDTMPKLKRGNSGVGRQSKAVRAAKARKQNNASDTESSASTLANVSDNNVHFAVQVCLSQSNTIVVQVNVETSCDILMD